MVREMHSFKCWNLPFKIRIGLRKESSVAQYLWFCLYLLDILLFASSVSIESQQ